MSELRERFEKKIIKEIKLLIEDKNLLALSNYEAGAMAVLPILEELVEALQSISYKVDESEPFMSLYIPTVDMIEINKTLDKLNAWLAEE